MSALPAHAGVQPPPTLQRARGRAAVSFKRLAAETRLDDLWQQGSCKVRLPKVHDGRGPVAVLINTAGGVTGGDHIVYEADWAPHTRATVTTQAAERIYRRSAGVGRVENRLTIGSGASAFWLPQETIVFDRAGLDRTTDVTIAADATLTAVEAVVLGRTAMGEEVRTLAFTDSWRVRRGGALVYADTLRLVGDTRAILAGRATGGGARAVAAVLHIGPGSEERLATVRDLSETIEATSGAEAAFSAFDGMIAGRILAPDGLGLRAMMIPVLECLTGGPLPRVWSI